MKFLVALVLAVAMSSTAQAVDFRWRVANRAMLDLQSLAYALATSRKKSFIVEFPKYKISEKFSLLDARKSLGLGKKSILVGCDK